MNRIRVGIIGGGAAGMMAAITAARKGSKVTLFEANDRIGKKILMTGNGKCNLTNMNITNENYYGGNIDKISSYIETFDQNDAITFFNGLGLMVKNKNGYVYPVCEQASAVLDVLRFELYSLNVSIVNNFKVSIIERNKNMKYLVSDGEKKYSFDKIIICCGGMAAPKTGSDGNGYALAKKLGHTITKTYPALCGLKCSEGFMKTISGVRACGKVSLYADKQLLAEESGEIQFTDYGISGIPVFQLSRIANSVLSTGKKLSCEIDFFDVDEEDYNALCESRKMLLDDRSVEEFFTGMLNKKIMSLLIKQVGIKPTDQVETISENKINEVFSLCRKFLLHIVGSNNFDQAQVTAGGVDINELDESLQSKISPGLYFAGEIIDVDGKCGGYNLQWAWSSGYIAGISCSK